MAPQRQYRDFLMFEDVKINFICIGFACKTVCLFLRGFCGGELVMSEFSFLCELFL